MTPQWISGIDQSLSHTAIVCLPPDVWEHPKPWARIRSSSVVTGPCQTLTAEVKRRAYIADQVVVFLRKHGVYHVALESPAYSRFRLKDTLPVLAVLLDRLVSAGFEPWIAPQSSARCLLLGPTLRRKQGDPKPKKDHLKVRVRRAFGEPPDGRPWGYDESDALCVANWLVSEIGGKALACPASSA